jgi:hypothetical protein
MNSGRHILTQFLALLHRQALNRVAERYNIRARHFGCRQQLICMGFAQLTWRGSLRDMEECLNAKGAAALYHLGLREPVARMTLAEANEQCDWRLWQDLATGLIKRAQQLHAGEDLGWDLDETIYAPDSTTIDLSLQLFPWAEFRATKAGVKLHTQIDLRGPIPVHIEVGAGRYHDVLWLDTLIFEPGALYLPDRAYMDFTPLAKTARAGAFFVTRAKDKLRFSRIGSNPKIFGSGVSSDQIGHPTLPKAREAFPWPLRRIRFVDPDTGKKLIFLTNHLEVPAETVAALYKKRWQIELLMPLRSTIRAACGSLSRVARLFRWIKKHLLIKRFFGTSPNAVKTQVWIAVSICVLIAILHQELKLPGSLHRTLQILSVHPFETLPLHQLLTQTPDNLWTPMILTNCGCGS